MTKRYFKVLPEEFANALVERGEMMLSSLAYFAQLERNDPSGQTGDRFETGPIVFVENLQLDEDTSQETLDEIAHFLSIKIERGAGVKLTHLSALQETPHSLVWCFTNGDPSKASGLFNVNAAVEILDVPGLVSAIYSESSTASGVRLSDIVEPGTFGDVAYVEKVISLADAFRLPAGAFVKPLRFSEQDETRLVFPALSSALHDRISIRIPDPGRFFRKVSLPDAVERSEEQSIDVKPPLIEHVRDILRRARQVRELESLRWNRIQDAMHLLPIEARLSATRAKFNGEELTADQAAVIALQNQLSKVLSIAFEDSIRDELFDIAWRARLEHGFRSTYVGEGFVSRNFPEMLLQKLTGEVRPGAINWHNAITTAVCGPEPATPSALPVDLQNQ